jgi:RHS repeat-associated protein
LGQVTSGKRYWSDTSAVAGEQFGYRFDDIGNRLTTESGGNEWGAGTRWSNSTNSLLNQLSSRSVPSTFDVIGSATNTSTVTVNDQATTRKGTFYRAELTAANATGPVYIGVTNLSVLNNGSSTNDLLRTETGNVFLPQALEQFTYDVDGNLLTDGRWTYAWDGENRLVSLTANTNVPTAARLKIELGYDVQGRRTSKKVSAWNGSSYVAQSTNRFVYDGWNLLGELDVPSGTLVRSYVWGTDLSGTTQGAGGVGGLLMTVIQTGAEAGTYFAAYDGNGNVVGLIRSSDGLARAEYEYGPFGEVIRASGPIAKTNPFRFSTKFQDDESDLLYYGYRYYNAFTGRWPSRDPIAERGGANLYGFVGNDCLNRVDLAGLAWYDFYSQTIQQAVDLGKASLDGSQNWVLAGTAATVLDIAALGLQGLPSSQIGPEAARLGDLLGDPTLEKAIGTPLANSGSGAGAFSGDPSWENAGGLAQDISTLFSVMAGLRGGQKALAAYPGGARGFLQNLLKSGKITLEEYKRELCKLWSGRKAAEFAGNPAGKLAYDAANKTWTSPGGLVYGQGSAQGNRVLHILDHTVANPAKPVHSIFSVPRNQVIGLVDEAWAARSGQGVPQANGNRVWTVGMGRQVGTGGQTAIQIVVRDGTTEIITAFPK